MNINNAEFFRSYGEFEQIPPSTSCEIVFAGRSNVGKSSLINKVFNRKKLARVSSVPGKTATINFYSCDGIYAVDLPGYGYAKRSHSEKLRWQRLIEGYLTSDRNIGLIFQLIDMRHPPTSDDLGMINFMIDSELPFAVVFTKADKLKKTEREERMKSFMTEIPCFDEITSVCFSAETGEGAEEIRGIMAEFADNAE